MKKITAFLLQSSDSLPKRINTCFWRSLRLEEDSYYLLEKSEARALLWIVELDLLRVHISFDQVHRRVGVLRTDLDLENSRKF